MNMHKISQGITDYADEVQQEEGPGDEEGIAVV